MVCLVRPGADGGPPSWNRAGCGGTRAGVAEAECAVRRPEAPERRW